MTPETLRRKLRKKLKRKPYRKCPKCGKRMKAVLDEGYHDGWHLWAVCGGLYFLGNYKSGASAYGRPDSTLSGIKGCGFLKELFLDRVPKLVDGYPTS